VTFNASGVIDGLAAIFPKTVSRLFSLASKATLAGDDLEELRRLQWKVSTAEEFIVQNGILGIREAIYRVRGFGQLPGGRLPLRGCMTQGAYEAWNHVFSQMAQEEEKGVSI
jgi:2-keto-3-deoxy-L-rhamnonate aldolase